MKILEDISNALIIGNAKKVKELTEQAILENIPPKDILDKGLIVGMGVIGERFKNNDCFVPEVLIAARAMHAGMDIIKPLLAQKGNSYFGRWSLGRLKEICMTLAKIWWR